MDIKIQSYTTPLLKGECKICNKETTEKCDSCLEYGCDNCMRKIYVNDFELENICITCENKDNHFFCYALILIVIIFFLTLLPLILNKNYHFSFDNIIFD